MINGIHTQYYLNFQLIIEPGNPLTIISLRKLQDTQRELKSGSGK